MYVKCILSIYVNIYSINTYLHVFRSLHKKNEDPKKQSWMFAHWIGQRVVNCENVTRQKGFAGVAKKYRSE